LSDSSKQIASGKNVPLTHSYATAYFCLKSIVDPFVPTNDGLYRAVSIVAPEGLVVNPVAPAAVSSRNMTSMILAEALTNALGQAAPSRSVAAGGPGQGCISAGTDPASARYFINYENLAGGQGARCTADGMDVVMINMTNTSNLPIEAMEMEFPLRIERYELVCDSGGPGKYRGGMGVLRDMRILADNASVSLRSARQRYPAAGLAGGRPGGLGAFIRNPGKPDETRLGLTTSGTPLANGDVLRVITPGGGGYGNPAERDPEAVRRDLREGKISADVARDAYRLK
jgi:N-methylhydantoinase B